MPPVYRVDVGGDLNGKESILEEPQDSKVCVQLLRRTALAVFKQSLAHPFQSVLKVHVRTLTRGRVFVNPTLIPRSRNRKAAGFMNQRTVCLNLIMDTSTHKNFFSASANIAMQKRTTCADVIRFEFVATFRRKTENATHNIFPLGAVGADL